ncbi:Ubiquitin carboxyl-terminal hydrolase 10 [Heterocephalus glaber]|uniref:ubiquitinyl hydrolase 1 n=1 Tax=Heterocephalus glaber TaxID=10181 RepID=G5AL06_HETGA|nr:Ubiquitin carboxyl-terminal hydrolase 10 [Heterocephalus glaber]
MARHGLQYIFGDFSPDEFNQFFVMPRSSVELPLYSGTALCGTQAADELPDGQEYQRIEFGVNEVIDPSDTLPRAPCYSISSTLNPQAPECILGCTASKKTPDGLDQEVNFSSLDRPYPDLALALVSSSHTEVEALENAGGPGGLGQRKRKKKKQLPGYYSYLKTGGDKSISTEAVVNGHANSAGLSRVAAKDAEFMGDMLPPVSPRTCDSPQNSTDFLSDTVPDGPYPGALNSSARTVGQPKGCCGPDFEQACLPADHLLRTAVALPCTATNTTENLGIASGQVLESLSVGTAANRELHTVESTDSNAAKLECMPPPANSALLAPIPINQPPKSWASLFHDAKPSSSSPVVYVETKCSLPASSPLVSEKQVEVKGLVPVSEDPVPMQIAELLENITLAHKPVSWQPSCQALGDKIMRAIHPGAAFEPTYIYRLLTVIKSSLSEKGRQEDAEEYLDLILNGLHEEMLSLKRSPLTNNEEQQEQGEGHEEEWEQVGPRNKMSVTHQADFIQIPITSIFGGHIRSVVYQQSSKESATLQPFFMLQLDIKSDKICTMEDALESLVARESVQGYTTKTKQEVEISRRVTLEKLPPVFVLHLKCFMTYRLIAVVYHHCNSATGGHYTTNVFQIGLNSWLCINNQMVKVIQQYKVLKPTDERTTYLLYYRRMDLL